MVEEHFLGERRTLCGAKAAPALVFLACQMHALAVNIDGLGVEIDAQIAGFDDRLSVTLERRTIAWMRATNSSLWNGLVIVIGAEAETAHLVVDASETRGGI